MAGVDTRNIDRDSLFLLADLAFAGQSDCVRVKIRNLSAGGLMAESDLPVSPGTRLTIDIRNVGKVDGTVAWVQGHRFGVAFTQEIDPKKARSQIATSGQSSSVPRYARAVLDYGQQEPWRKNIRPI